VEQASKGSFGYNVRIAGRHSKWFSDNKYGCAEAAFKAAKKYRDSEFAELPEARQARASRIAPATLPRKKAQGT
jgi:hypothetical protein